MEKLFPAFALLTGPHLFARNEKAHDLALSLQQLGGSLWGGLHRPSLFFQVLSKRSGPYAVCLPGGSQRAVRGRFELDKQA